MAEEVKRPVVRARRIQGTVVKPARRRQRQLSGPRTKTTPPAAATPPLRSPGQGVSITVQIPALRRPKPGVAAAGDVRPRRKLFPAGLIIPVLLLAVGYAAFGGTALMGTKKPEAVKPVAAAERTEPAFQPLIPSAEEASVPRYDGKRDLVTYTTTFSGARLTVSQQPLPAKFAKDKDALTQAADSIKAKQRLDTDSGPLYIMTDEEAGSQLALFAGKQSLVFIHSASKLDDVSWKSFVELLQAKSWEDVI